MSLLFYRNRDFVFFILFMFLLVAVVFRALNIFGFIQWDIEAWKKTLPYIENNWNYILPLIAIGLATIAIILDFDELLKWSHSF